MMPAGAPFLFHKGVLSGGGQSKFCLGNGQDWTSGKTLVGFMTVGYCLLTIMAV